MIIDKNYWSKVARKVITLILSVILVYLAFQLAGFYMPFLIAFLLALLIEPVIKFLMKKVKLKRRTSAIIVFVIVLGIIIGLLIWGISMLISESANLLENMGFYFEKISTIFQDFTSKFDMKKWHLPEESMIIIQNTGMEVITNVTNVVKDWLTGIVKGVGSLPAIGICVTISFLALYFMCTDKIYMLDVLEHHLPEVWVKKIGRHVRQIAKSLGSLLKAEMILVGVSFVVCLIGLYIFQFTGLKVEYPLMAAIGIGFVDALPIFGSAAVMIPWAIICACNGDITLAVALLVLLAVMGIVRQFLEPKVVAGQIGVHPIFTLIAMYTGFKFMGIIGLLVGPIILVVLKNIYGTLIDKGVVKAILDREG